VLSHRGVIPSLLFDCSVAIVRQFVRFSERNSLNGVFFTFTLHSLGFNLFILVMTLLVFPALQSCNVLLVIITC